jgi:undecaprenyl-diphosphatase
MLIRDQLSTWDHAVIFQLNRINRRHIGRFFALISRLGDGYIWFALMLILPLHYGPTALSLSLLMLLSGACATLIYKIIKQATHRVRPCHETPTLILTVAPLDRFSFPSGHTLHAVCFTWIICAAFPAWSWILIPFTLLVALSRMVLGLHYFSDVVVGAFIGGVIGLLATHVGAYYGVILE